MWLSRRLWWREAESLDFVEGLLQCEKGEEEVSLSPFLVRDLGAQSLKVIQRVHKVWKKSVEERQGA